MLNKTSIKNSEHPYSIVLSHDVDNLSLRSYPVFSKMTAAFLKRCLWNNLLRTCRGDIRLSVYFDSIKWVIVYPLVKLGMVDDPWESVIFDIMTLERQYNAYSTFFFIPYPDRPGHVSAGNPAPGNRAASYDVKQYREMLQKIESEGWEVGVHGLDAHISAEAARKELKAIKALLPGKDKIGMRMHWLYQTDDLWKNLEDAGFYYDATYGNNKQIGFINGHKKPFKRHNVWVIPLNIMDSTLLGHWLMGLSISDAWLKVEQLLNKAKDENAVVTILWHNNSFTAFYYWGELYEKILRKVKADNARIMRCVDICDEMDEAGP